MAWTKRTTPSNARDINLVDESNTDILDEDGNEVLVFSQTAWSKR